MYIYNYLVFCGRFQPFHAGHYHVVKESLSRSSNIILVLGSHMSPRTSKNPFSTQERIDIIKSCFTHAELDRIHFAVQYDHPYNEEKWIAGIQASVNTIIFGNFNPDPIKIGIIGYDKDHSSYYLKKFPAWDIIDIEPYKVDGNLLNASDLRHEMFVRGWTPLVDPYKVNEQHRAVICMKSQDIWKQINNEISHIKKYKQQWSVAPYPPIFVTVDAVVTQSGHLLVVKRGAMPGEGLLALPGGFVNQYETLKEAVIRELYEETKIDIPKPVLNGSIISNNVYDYPYRSERGRTITHAYHFKLSDRNDLPKIKGSDDAKDAFWMTLSEFAQSRDKFFEDHWAIVEHMLGL